MANIHFFAEEISFKVPQALQSKRWLKQIIKENQYKLVELNYIFCNDAYLLGINQEYLQHDTYTDIITFDQAEAEKHIEGDIFISVERVQDNAAALGIPFEEELRRVMSHGLWHLLGYRDKSPQESQTMRQKEEEALRLWQELLAQAKG